MHCPSHAQQQMQLKPPGAPYRCNGCREVGFGRSYHCGNSNCSYILHEECFKVAPIASHPFFPGSCLEFYEKPPGDVPRFCNACVKDVLGFVYHCPRKGYDLHPCCLNLEHGISDEDLTLELSHEVPSNCVKCDRKNVRFGVNGWSYVSSSDSGGTYCLHVSCLKDLILENPRNSGKMKKYIKFAASATLKIILSATGLDPVADLWDAFA